MAAGRLDDQLVLRSEPAARRPAAREADARALERLYPLCRSMSGDGVRASLDVVAESVPLHRHRRPVRDDLPRLDRQRRVERARRVDRRRQRSPGRGLPRAHPAPGRLQRPGAAADDARAAATAPVHPARAPGLDPLPDLLLRAHVGLLPHAATARRDGRGALRRRGRRRHRSRRADPRRGAWCRGRATDEVLVSVHTCHPSLANDNLSGIVVATELAAALAALPRRRFTYRFVFAPGIIGSLAWLTLHEGPLDRIRHGLVLAGAGRTRAAGLQADPPRRPRRRPGRRHVVRRAGGEVRDYSPYGYDERQYNSLGFDLPVGRLTRTPHGEYPEYHTSADDLDFVRDEELVDAYAAVGRILDVLEHDARLRQPQPPRRAAAGPARALPQPGGPGRERGDDGAALDDGVLGRGHRRCWTSPTAPTSTSPSSRGRRATSRAPGWWSRRRSG